MKKLILLMFCMILLIGIVSAANWDNKLVYSKNDLKVIIKNSILGIIPTSEIGTAELKSHSSVNEIKEVGAGNQVVMWYDFNFKKLYLNGLGEVEFTDMKTGEEINRNYSFVYWGEKERDVYKSNCYVVGKSINGSIIKKCEQVITGKETYNNWLPYNSKDIPKGKIRIGLMTYVEIDDKVDGVWTLVGKKVKRHAVWTESLNVGLIAYWNLDETSGNISHDSLSTWNLTLFNMENEDWQGAGIKSGLLFDGVNKEMQHGTFLDTMPASLSVSLWFKPGITYDSGLGAHKYLFTKINDITGGTFDWIRFRISKTTGKIQVSNFRNGVEIALDSTTASWTAGTWYHIVFKIGADEMELWIDGSSEDTDASTQIPSDGTEESFSIAADRSDSFFNGTIDEIGIWNRSLNITEVTQLWNNGRGITYGLPPIVTLNSPIDNYNSTNPITFNGSVSAREGRDIANISLIIDGVYNETLSGSKNSLVFNTDCKAVVEGVLTDCDDEMFDDDFNTHGFYSYTSTTPRTEEFLDESFNTTSAGQVNITFKWGITTCVTGGCQAGYKLTCLDYGTSTYQTLFNTFVGSSNQNVNTTNTVTVNPVCVGNNVTLRHYAVNIRSMGGGTSEVRLFDVNITNEYNFTKILLDGSHNWTYEACDSEGKCNNATARSFIIDATLPTVNITYPTATVNYHLINTNLTLNWTVSDLNLDSCWSNYNGTNISVTCADNTTNLNITKYSNKNVTFYVNDTFGNENSDIQEWDYKVFGNSQTFNAETIEGVTETFVANITLGSGESITSVGFDYNGTSKSALQVSLGSDMFNLTSTFTIPLVTVDSNMSFFWIINLVSGQVNSSSTNQTVRNIGIDNCSVYSTVIFNYTMVDEESQTKLVGNSDNTSLELDIKIFNLDRSVSVLNFSTSYNQTNPVAVCLSVNLTNDTIYTLDSTVKYNADNYVIEYYNIQNFELENSSVPQNINLYDLLTADSTDFQISFKGEDFVFVENALIFIERQYVSEGVFKTVEIPKTDSNGQTIGHFVRNDIIYNIRVVKEGEILGNFNNIIAFCRDYVIGDCQIVLEAIPSALITFDYDEQLGIIFETVPTYNNNTNAISFSFVTDDATIKTVSMEVTRRDIFGNRSICNNTLTSASGTLLCTIDPNIDDTTLVTSIYVENQLVILSNVELERPGYGNLGYVLWFFLTFLFILFGRSKTEVLIALVISLIGAIALGITRGNIVGIGSAGIWMLVIVILGIWKINKENPQ